MRCDTCQAEVGDAAATCPVCLGPARGGSLARAETADGLSRMVDEELARAAVGGLLTRAESLGELIRDESLAGALDPSELGGMLARADAPEARIPEELDRLMPQEMSSMDIEGLSLAKLIDPASGDVRMLKPGLTLVRNRRYHEASEYWNLQRARVDGDPTRERLALLLLVLDAFTWKLAGDVGRMRAALERVRSHPHAQRLKATRER